MNTDPSDRVDKHGTGVNIAGLIRSWIAQEFDLPFHKVVELFDPIERQIEQADWVRLSSGTTFDKTFVPVGERTKTMLVVAFEKHRPCATRGSEVMMGMNFVECSDCRFHVHTLGDGRLYKHWRERDSYDPTPIIDPDDERLNPSE